MTAKSIFKSNVIKGAVIGLVTGILTLINFKHNELAVNIAAVTTVISAIWVIVARLTSNGEKLYLKKP